MENRSPEEILFDQLMAGEEGDPPPAPGPGPTDALSVLQEHLWLVHQLIPDSSAYIIPCHLRILGPLDPGFMKRALRALWRRHEALRTVFPVTDGRPSRALLPETGLEITEGDFRQERDPGAWMATYLACHAGPFNLETGPLFRVCLFRTGPEEHVLLMDVHHINADGVSLEILRQDLFGIYEALREDRQLPPAPEETYGDYVASERAATEEHGLERALEERVQALSGAPGTLPFAFDKPVPGAFYQRGAMVDDPGHDPARLAAAFERGRGEGLTPFMVLLAAYGILLHQQTGQEDLLIGAPVSLRGNGRFDRTVGLFVNTCVARLDLGGDPTLLEAMERSRASARAMLRNPAVPMDHLVRALRQGHTPGRPPLVQALLSFVHDPSPAPPPLPDLRIEPVHTARDSAMFELTLEILHRPEGGLCALEYSTDLWEEASILNLFGPFHRILEAMATRPETRLGALNLQPGEPLDGEPMAPPGRLLPEALAEQARLRPEAPALLAGGTWTTFGDLDRRVALRRGQLATLAPGSVLGLACAPGLEWVVTALAALAEGLTVLPLDTQAPPERLAFILDHARATALWHDAAFTPGEALPCPLLDAASVAPAPPVQGPTRSGPATRAYLLYTSGTSGRPKGVEVSHGALAAHLDSAIQAYGLTREDRALMFAPLFFDASWEQLFAPLVAGASVLVRDAQLWPPQELSLRIREAAVTVVDLPPQYLRELLFYWGQCPLEVPRALRLVISGGEAMPSALAQAWFQGPLGQVPLINAYGPTEGVVTAVHNRLDATSRVSTANGVVPIGLAMPGRILRVLDPLGRATGRGVPGELCLGGPALAEGYLGEPGVTEAVFRSWVDTPEGGTWAASGTPGALRLYRTGDRVRLGPDGRLEFLGRLDRQLKVRGFRMEPGEIEAALGRHPGIAQAFVQDLADAAGGQMLVAWCRPARDPAPSSDELTAWAGRWLPATMTPDAFVFLAEFPTTPSGKIDAAALPRPEAPSRSRAAQEQPADSLETRIAALWAEILGLPDVGRHDNFFDLGGHSLTLVRVHTRLVSDLGATLPLVDLFAHPTVASLASRLRGETRASAPRGRRVRDAEVAVIGMAGRFPGASDVEALWANLAAGRESIRFFTPEELEAGGVPLALRSLPDYVPAHGHLDGATCFDAGFFGYTPKEAEIIDPQQRLFLEEAWHALEHAGYDPDRFPGDIAVFGGMGFNTYLLDNLGPALRRGRSADAYAISLGNDKDFITTRVSYKLNLRGPSVNVNTACSTSLVAIHMAAEALRSGECDLALAGGATLQLPPVGGYLYQAGGIASPDGHCRAFAQDALGTVGGSGAALVVLKRLQDALADGDTIHAVIKGSATNNDGADKVGFTAPGLNRQRDVIRAALDRSGISARDIGYVEAHGTGTPMGDPIEVQALTQAFAPDDPQRQSCYLGSIKSNLGHLDTAAGVAGFIKATLALREGLIPPSLHCQEPSPRIGFENTPFRVAQALTPWPGEGPRRAGVSSFGMGGTNAHVVLEQAPPVKAPARPFLEAWCLPISARTPESLLALARNLARHLDTHPEADPADILFTLAQGRRRFAWRTVVLGDSREGCAQALRALDATGLLGVDRDGAVLSGHGLPQGEAFSGRPAFNRVRAFAQDWLTGATPEWRPAAPGRRIPLPTCVFAREEHWIEAQGEEPAPAQAAPDHPVKRPLETWFHFPRWERLPLGRPDPAAAPPLLLLHGGSPQELRWMEALKAQGRPFAAWDTGTPGEELARALPAGNGPLACWHLGALPLAPAGPPEHARRLEALLGDLGTLTAATGSRPLTLVLFSPHQGGLAQEGEPAFTYLDAAGAVLPHEVPNLSTRVLRLDPGVPDPATLDRLGSLPDLPGRTCVLLLAEGSLWRRTSTPMAAEAPERGAARLKEQGVYLVTGGLGGIGLALAEHLARTCRARLVLVSRRPPGPAALETLSILRAFGSDVTTATLDMGDAGAVLDLVDGTIARWGRIDGVIHAAGVPGGRLAVRTRLEDLERVARAKIAGTLALAAALRGREPDFVLLCSSLTAQLGGPGQVAYAAANAWMDAFAASRSRNQPGVWTSVQWDSWAQVGMAARAGEDPGIPLATWTLAPGTYWPWGEHRVEGVPMLPGTAYLEMFRQALGTSGPLELLSVTLDEPLVHGGEASRQVQVLRDGDDLVLLSQDGTRSCGHARAKVGPIPGETALEPLAAIEARCTLAPPAPPEAPSGIAIDAGPRWQIAFRGLQGPGEGLAWLELPSRFSGDLAEHPLHPALLDMALSYTIGFLEGGTGLLPWRYEKVRIFAPLTGRIASHVRVRSHTDRILVLDVDIRDASGRRLLEVEGYTLLRPEAQAQAQPHSPRVPARARAAAMANPFAMEPGEGVQAFLRTLAWGEPVLSLCTIDWKFAELPLASTGAPTPGPEAPPAPEAPLRAPGTDAEGLLARIWEEVLGVGPIGPEDDLLDLGADSFSALQASARVKELTGSDMSMARFFERATIANLARDLQAPPTPATPTIAYEEGEL